MFAPISARLASSCSRNGTSEAATETSCFGRDVDVVDFGLVDEDEVALAAGIDDVLHDVQLGVELDVGLRDGVAIFLPRGEVEAEGRKIHGALLVLLELLVQLVRLGDLEVVALAQTGLAGVGDGDVVEHPAVLDAAVGRLDEAVLVDAREARERADEADVRAFRRLNRADAAVVSGVHVADFEAGALTRETTRPKGGEAALVRDLRERVGLVHELRELRGAEELTNRGHDRLGVDEVVRHGRRHLLIDRHLFLDGALHADEADAELVLHQLADGADAAVAEMIDVVDHADVLAQLEQVADGAVEVLGGEGALVEAGGVLVLVQLDVELEAADAREVVLARIEEHAFEERGGGVERRRVAGTQLAVDLDERLFGLAHGVAAEGVGDDVAHVVALGEEDLEAW